MSGSTERADAEITEAFASGDLDSMLNAQYAYPRLVAERHASLAAALQAAEEALREIRNVTEAAGHGEMPVRWIAERARAALAAASTEGADGA